MMPRFIAVHTLPGSEAEFLEMSKELTPRIPEGFTWKLSYCDFENHKFFCEWEAPSREALSQAFYSTYKIPFEAIYPVKLFNVATSALED